MYKLMIDLLSGIPIIELIIFLKSFYVLMVLPEMDSLTFATFILAFATIALALMTYLLSKDSTKNIKLSKENLVEQHLLREMEQLIKPLYKERKNFEDLEVTHAYHRPKAILFWKKRETDKYLAPNDLRHLIEEYLIFDNELYNKYNAIFNKIWVIVDSDEIERIRDHEMHAPDDLFQPYIPPSVKYEELKKFLNVGLIGSSHSHLPLSDERISWLEKVDELITKLEPGSEILSCVNEIKVLVENDIILKAKREALIDKIEARYRELERKIDNIHESLDRD